MGEMFNRIREVYVDFEQQTGWIRKSIAIQVLQEERGVILGQIPLHFRPPIPYAEFEWEE